MTLYSVNRDRLSRVPLAATFLIEGIYPTTRTVTSVDLQTAEELADLLNRISAWAAAPVIRSRGPAIVRPQRPAITFPDLHLRAFTDQAATDQLAGEFFHSLWYTYICASLAADLDILAQIVEQLKTPIATAVWDEVEAEFRALLDVYAGRPAERTFHYGREPLRLVASGQAVEAYTMNKLDQLQAELDPEGVLVVAGQLKVMAQMAAFLRVPMYPLERRFEVGGGPETGFHSVALQAPTDLDPRWELTIHSPNRLAAVCELPEPLDDSQLMDHLQTAMESEGCLLERWAAATVGAQLHGTPYVVARHQPDNV